MTTRILFVCLGNICRSPSAEAVTAARIGARDIVLDSAGIADWHRGKPPYAPMQDAARARALDMSGLRARQVSRDDFDRFDLIIAMDRQNQQHLEDMRPEGASVPVWLMTQFAPQLSDPDIPDPYYTRDFDGALDLIELAAEGLLRAFDGGSLPAPIAALE